MVERVYDRISKCLTNKLHPDALSAPEASYLRFFIYKAACRIVSSRDRKNLLKTMPSNLQPMIRDKAKWIINYRNSK